MKLYEIFGIGGNALGFGGGSGGGSNPFASGGVTLNVLPKSNGAGALADSSITDNGTTISSAEFVSLSHAGDNTNAILQLHGTATTGLMWGSANNAIGLQVDSTNWILCANNTGNQLQLPSTGVFGWSSATSFASANSDTFLRRRSAANIAMGGVDLNGVPVAQTLSVQNAITGSNLAGSVFTIAAPLGTGNAAGSATKLQRALMQATGTTAQTNVDALVIGESKTLSNTSATATSLATISVPSNSGGGCSGFVTVVASDGTNFDSETQSFNVSYVNKAGALTIGTPAITASTAANNSGSATIGLTVVAGTNAVDIKVTPVFTTIVPTTVTAFIEIHNHGTGNVTIN